MRSHALGEQPILAAQPFNTASAPLASQQRPLFDLRALGGALLRSVGWICLVVGLCLMAGIIYLMVSPRTFEATSQIEISPPSNTAIASSAANHAVPEDSREVDRLLQTQVDLLQTRQMAVKVLQKLRSTTQYADKLKDARPEDLQGMLVVAVPRNSRIIPVAADHSDPVFAADVANTYATSLIEENLSTHTQSLVYSRDYLGNQLNVARAELERSKRALLDYAAQQGLVDASEGSQTGQGTRSLVTTGLLMLNSSYAQAKADRIRAQQRWQQAQATPLLSLPEVVSNSAVQGLLQQKAVLQAKLMEDRQRYGAEYPGLTQQTANIRALDAQVSSLAGNVRNSIHDQYRTALQQEGALSRNVSSVKGQTLAEQAKGVRYDVLQRQVNTSQELYDALLQNFKQISAQMGVSENSIAIVDKAVPPTEPLSPNTTKTLGVAIAAGLVLGVIAAFVREQLDRRVHDATRTAADLGLPVLAQFPPPRGDMADADAVADPNSPAAAAGRALHSRLELSRGGQVLPVVCVARCGQAEGEGIVALSLASALATAQRRVLLVQADDGARAAGWRGRGTQTANSWQQGITRSDSGISCLNLGNGETAAASFEDLQDLLDEMGKTYDAIVIDAPWRDDGLSSLRLAPAADATLLVLHQNSSRTDELLNCAEALRQSANLVGAVVVRAPRRSVLFRARRHTGFTAAAEA